MWIAMPRTLSLEHTQPSSRTKRSELIQQHLDTFDTFLAAGLPMVNASKELRTESYLFSGLHGESQDPDDHMIYIRKSLADHVWDSTTIEVLFVAAVLHEVAHIYRCYVFHKRTLADTTVRAPVGESGEVVEREIFGGLLSPVAKRGFRNSGGLDWSKLLRMDVEINGEDFYSLDDEWIAKFLTSLRTPSSPLVPLHKAEDLPRNHVRYRLTNSTDALNDGDTSDDGDASNDAESDSHLEMDGGGSHGGGSDSGSDDDSYRVEFRLCSVHSPSNLQDSPSDLQDSPSDLQDSPSYLQDSPSAPPRLPARGRAGRQR
ncbi:hypothetical protein FA95DRAFT_95876 [Auriscalpium vulgare]|uniref:Uncharacterized protein n=1 Tax=Auriscalpium vulgare TaxID=40419 RepID=A0ACB8RNL7_9AGAM|nr:hypothetical protein FA95DRAFT_95876 [Auriscalpium vulgare]